VAVAVDVFRIKGHRRSGIVADAMAQGIRAAGETVRERFAHDYPGKPLGDVAVFYGYVGALPKVMTDYSIAPRACVYVDLGYWGRRDGGRFVGYHKVSVNARHPVAYYRKRQHDASRFARHNVAIEDWRSGGGHILIAGMGDKGARAEGQEPARWERNAIAEIRRYTDRPIVYRPKPSWHTAKPIEGTRFSPREEDVGVLLRTAHAVVTHHSNVAIEGILAGVPAFCWGGVAKDMALQDLSRIEKPVRPDGRAEWAADIAWCQWSIAEMAAGDAWRYLKNEGLVP
jgi:hypothetical protein